MKKTLIFFCYLIIAACTKTKTITIVAENQPPTITPAPTTICPGGGYLINGIPICNGLSVGVSVSNSDTAICSNGGHKIEFFRDYNSNNVLDLSSEFYISIVHVCNGQNGSNAIINVEPAPNTVCINGGILVNGLPVCNGTDVLQNNTGIFTAKLCPADNDPYAEYGVFMGGELYGVLYASQNSHPHQIGFVKLLPGTYVTTTTSPPKTFTYTKNSIFATLSCNGVFNTYDLFNGDLIATSSSGGSSSATGSCTVQQISANNDVKNYLTIVSGSGLSNNFRMIYVMNNSSYKSETGCWSNFGFLTDNTCNSANYVQLPNNTVRFTPVGGATSFNVTLKGNNSLIIESAKMLIISTGELINCVLL